MVKPSALQIFIYEVFLCISASKLYLFVLLFNQLDHECKNKQLQVLILEGETNKGEHRVLQNSSNL